MHKEAGFNLIELMIVIAIMATLAAIAIPSYSHYLNKSRAISAVVLTEPVRTAVMEYALMHNGELAGLSEGSLGLNEQEWTAGSKDVTHIQVTPEGEYRVAVTATLNDQLGVLTWTGTYQPASGTLIWECTYPAGSALSHYAPQGCVAG